MVSLFIYKDTKWSELPNSFVEASVSTATIMVMVGLSKASSYVVVTSGLPALLLDTFSSLTESRVLILLLLNLLFLIIGMLMEANAAIIMMTPILMPLLTLYGINPLMFGIVMSFNLCIGLVTPPVGLYQTSISYLLRGEENPVWDLLSKRAFTSDGVSLRVSRRWKMLSSFSHSIRRSNISGCFVTMCSSSESLALGQNQQPFLRQ